MHFFKHLSLSLLAVLSACGDAGNAGTDATITGPGTGPTTGTTDPTTPVTTTTPTTTDPSTGPTTDPTTTTTTGTTTPTTDPTGTTTEPPEDTDTTAGGHAFVFASTPPEDLVQLDRVGMPAVAIAVISEMSKDVYNESTPTDDAAAKFIDDIVANVVALHAALDDDLKESGFTPCAAMICAAQAGPLVIPDTLQIDPGKPAGFPNGRRLADQAIDLTLAAVFIDLSKHPIDVLAKLPLNPPKNDKDFLAEFPHVAAPH